MDESADATQSEAFVAAGFFCVHDEWKRLRREWRKILKPHGIGYYRTSDWRNLQGDFKQLAHKWGQERARQIADRIRDRLAELMDGSTLLVGFGFGINMRDFNEIDAMPEARACQQWMREWHDYKVAAFRHVFFKVALTVVKDLQSGKYQNEIIFICDDDNRYPKIKRGFDRVRKKFPALGEKMLSLAPMNDKKIPELQMADFMADIARDMVSRHIASGGRTAEPKTITTRVLTVDSANRHSMLKVLRGEAVGV